MKMTAPNSILVFLTALGLSSAISLQASLIFSDSMNNPSTWILKDGPTPTFGSSFDVSNTVIYQNLSQTLSSDFSLTFTAHPDQDYRNMVVGLFDSTGTKGYTIYFDSNDNTTNGGAGTAYLLKYNQMGPLTTWADYNPFVNNFISGGFTSGVAPISSTFADFRLDWNSAGSISLYTNNVLRTTVTDTDLTSFSTVYIRGNASSLFSGNLQVSSTAPEPSTWMLLGIGMVVLAGRYYFVRFARKV